MNRQKTGQVLFWLGVVFVITAYILLWFMNSVHRVNTAAELSGTAWDPNGGFLFRVQGIFNMLGPFIALIGVLLYSGEKGSFFWLWGFLPLIAFGILFTWMPVQRMPALFGLGGGIIVVSYLGSLWVWTKTHTTYKGTAKTGKYIQLLGYSFLFTTALFLCLYIGQPNLLALKDMPVVSGESLLVTISVGWLLLFIGNYMVLRSSKEATAHPQSGA